MLLYAPLVIKVYSRYFNNELMDISDFGAAKTIVQIKRRLPEQLRHLHTSLQ